VAGQGSLPVTKVTALSAYASSECCSRYRYSAVSACIKWLGITCTTGSWLPRLAVSRRAGRVLCQPFARSCDPRFSSGREHVLVEVNTGDECGSLAEQRPRGRDPWRIPLVALCPGCTCDEFSARALISKCVWGVFEL
jgi:hypothetical protein